MAKNEKTHKVVKIGVVDTMFARYDMGAAARAELSECPGYESTFTVVSKTVPGFKDLAVAAKNLIERDGCSIVVALGMPGKAPIDKQCAHEAAQGIMQAQLLTSTPILEVYWMLFEPEQLANRAGQGIRQGFEDAGPLVND